jgi:cell division GTPase FtsZ
MIGFIGLGAAGGNIVDEAVKNGFAGIAINYSQKDLDSLEHVEDRLKMVGSEGVGKNREEAIRLMGKNWESALAFVKERFSTPMIEVVIVSFSTGGGSGRAPVLIEILMDQMPEKTFVAAPILPERSEVLVNQMNCIQTSEELSNLNVAVFPIDNEQVRKKYPGYGKNKIYKETNETFIRNMTELVEYTERNSKNGVLDRKDLKTILSTKGVAIVATVDVMKISGERKDLTEEGIANAIHDSWSNSIFVPIHYDRILRSGFVFDGQEQLLPYINFGTIFGKFESGMPIDLFEGYYSGETGKIVSIISGLSWYHNRLKQIEDVIVERQSETEERLIQDNSYQSNVTSLSTKIRKKESKKQPVMDILSKYKR